jgi:hypothetical protein
MNHVGYIGYKEGKIGLMETTIATGGAALPITAIIDTAIALLPFLIPFISNAFQQPGADANNKINSIKNQLLNDNERQRLALVLATGQQISDKAKDVEAEKLLLWYRQNYPNDYQNLLSEDKIYFNNYLNSLRSRFGDGNNFYSNLQRAMFTDTEINYNASPVQSVTNLLSTNKNLLLYAGIGLAILLLIKK